MRCRICNRVYRINRYERRSDWYQDFKCKECSYFLDIFSYGINYLSDYYDKEDYLIENKELNNTMVVSK